MSEGVWTNNWQGVKNAMLCGFVRNGWSTVRDENGNLVDGYNGAMPMGSYQNVNAASSTYPALIFGTGTAAPAATDLGLSHKWTSGISRVAIVNGTLSYDDSTHTASKVVKATIQNTGVNPVTVTEWGIVGRAWRGSSSYPDILLYRALLDSPVTLNQYESATLSATITVQLTDPA